jgi:hypothetical protein
MDLQLLTWIGLGLALYALPLVVGASQSRLSTAIMLALAAYGGLCASLWSALGVLFLPALGLFVPQPEIAAVLVLAFLAGALQAALLAALGFGLKTWIVRLIARRRHVSPVKFLSSGVQQSL